MIDINKTLDDVILILTQLHTMDYLCVRLIFITLTNNTKIIK